MKSFIKNTIKKIKHRHLVDNVLKNKASVILTLSLALLLFALFSPTLNYRLGLVFFGKNNLIYNTYLARYFFTYASDPILGNPIPFADYQLARISFIQGNLDRAIYELENSFKQNPKNNKAYYLLGLIYGYQNKEYLAIDAFSTYIQKEPTTWAGRNDKAWLQFRVGDIDGALQTIEPLREQRSNPWVQNTYGVLLMNKGKYSEAKEALFAANTVAQSMSAHDWGYAYPGNDPRIYTAGLDAMKKSIQNNLELIDKKTHTTAK
jgi:tetratricopeptide (TPR) repeat protein